MGKGSSEIQRDIERRRAALSQRIEELDRRVREDVEKTRAEAQARFESLTERAKGPAGKAKDRAMTLKERAASLNDRVEESPVGEHPNLLVAGALATGVALGFATGGRDGKEPEPMPEIRERVRYVQEEKPGRIGQSIDSIVSGIKSEIIVMLRDFVDKAMKSGEEASQEAEKVPAFMRSAWDNISSRIEPDRPRQRTAATATAGAHVEAQDRDLPRDRPLSDMEQRTASDMGLER